MRKLQEIFDLLIAEEYYLPKDYMCNSLHFAELAGVITPQEQRKAERCIANYLNKSDNVTMTGVLIDLGLPWQNGEAMEIYKDWKKRPSINNNNSINNSINKEHNHAN